MQFSVSMILQKIYLKYKDSKENPVIRINVETKFNSFNGLLEFGDYLGEGSYIQLSNSSCSSMGQLRIDGSFIAVSDIISFAYTDLELNDKEDTN